VKKVAIGVAALFVLIAGAAAYAAIPDAQGVIHACYKLSNPAKGAIVVINSEAGESCPNGFAALNWNQTGPQGPAGPQGSAGISGYEVVQHSVLVPIEPLNYGHTRNIYAVCPPGKHVLGGGGFAGSITNAIERSMPDTFNGQDAWHIGTVETRDTFEAYDAEIYAWAICAYVNS